MLVITLTGKKHTKTQKNYCRWVFSITSGGIALFSLTRHISPARQGFAFPLHDGHARPE